MNPRYRGARRFLSNRLAMAAVVVTTAVLGIALAAVFIGLNGNKGPVSIAAPVAVPSSGDLRIYLTPSEGGAQSLSLVNAGLTAPSLAGVPLIYSAPHAEYLQLRKYLWGQSAITFSGTGFSGVWPNDGRVRLVLQLNGPIKIGDYSFCLAVRVNREEGNWSCGNGFSSFEFVQGGYTVVLNIQAPPRLEPSDRLEISLVFGASFGEGERTGPNVVYGGDVLLRTSFLEISSAP